MTPIAGDRFTHLAHGRINYFFKLFFCKQTTPATASCLEHNLFNRKILSQEPECGAEVSYDSGSCQTFRVLPTLAPQNCCFPTWLSCSGCPVPATLSWPSCSVRSALDVPAWLSFLRYPGLELFFWRSYSCYLLFTLLFWVSYILSVMFFLSTFGCPILIA
jgi:hypothetical protein